MIFSPTGKGLKYFFQLFAQSSSCTFFIFSSKEPKSNSFSLAFTAANAP